MIRIHVNVKYRILLNLECQSLICMDYARPHVKIVGGRIEVHITFVKVNILTRDLYSWKNEDVFTLQVFITFYFYLIKSDLKYA